MKKVFENLLYEIACVIAFILGHASPPDKKRK